MLVPAVVAPQTILLQADVGCRWHGAVQPEPGRTPGREELLDIHGQVSVYLEHTRGDVVVLPDHEMSANLNFGNLTIPMRMSSSGTPDKLVPRWGVYGNGDGLICTAPGRASLRLGANVAPHYRDFLSTVVEGSLFLALGVTGASRPIRLNVRLLRHEKQSFPMSELFADVGDWAMASP
jgi:hypothetical protein